MELLIMRHAKSDWSGNHPDRERPLNRRGEGDARAMGEWLAGQRLTIGEVLSSSACRARQTAEAVAAAVGLAPARIRFRDDLYLAGRPALVRILDEALRQAGAGLLLVGHNPGLDELVAWLAAEPLQRTPQGKLMTTAALAAFRIPAGQPLRSGIGTLRFLVRPRELRKAGWPDAST